MNEMINQLEPLTWLWVLSVAGALAFFSAGALIVGVRRRAIAPPLARALGEVAALDDDRKRLADEVTRLSHELAESRRAREEPSARVVEVDSLKRRLAEAEELREENAKLRAISSRTRDLAQRVNVLESELAKARRAAPPSPPNPASSARSARPTARLPTSPALDTLDALVSELRRDPKVAAAVISDEIGLLVAGGGDGAETMAALGGYLAGVGVRAQGLLHLDAASRIIVEDDHGKILTATRLAGAPLVAVTLART
ncbi:MAG TPA: hypothetical protein VL463_20175 [Kofleriaceae bacterium]|jgi:predicted regulator of Ras-like GTPase activity (Roadblock/LC7/MglB family)|nr:hypothetical protein [Kofleriaceae bacterium]